MRRDEIKVRVFIEGVIVPKISSVVVGSFNNEASQAVLTMPPVPKLATEELVRARVHVFWSDKRIRRSRAENQWPLLFEGEIVADSYHKTPRSRHLSFRCQGYNTYWEQVYIYFYDLSHPNGAGIQSLWSNNLALFLGNKRLELDTNTAGVDLVSRLAEIVDENLDQPYYSISREIFEDSLNVNFFFQQANSDLKLGNRFTSVRDEFADLLHSRELLSRYLKNDITSISGQASMMQILKSILGVFRYQIICNPQPAYIDDALETKKTVQRIAEDESQVSFSVTQYLSRVTGLLESEVSDVSLTSSTTNSDIESIISSLVARVEIAAETVPEGQTSNIDFSDTEQIAARFELRAQRDRLQRLASTTTNPEKAEREPAISGTTDLLAQYLIIPDTRFTLPPTCNTIFPQDQSSFGLDRELLREPTRAVSTVDPETGIFRVFMAPANINEAAIPVRTVNSSNPNGYRSPIEGEYTITSEFGIRRDPLDPTRLRNHKGIDLGGNLVGKEVHAIDTGVIGAATFDDNGGWFVFLRHENGDATQYLHMQEGSIPERLKRGVRVEAGDVIGRVGSTGRRVTGPHLHLDYFPGGSGKEDPFVLLEATSESLEGTPGKRGNKRRGLTSAQLDAVGGAQAVETSARTIEADIEEGGVTDLFREFKYLTPEEQKKGIVPFFDQATARSHSLFTFLGGDDAVSAYMAQLLQAELLWQRFSQRTIPAMTTPFNPSPVAGFPSLIIDKVRSIIARITSITHTISVGGGSGNATSNISFDSPRYWNEGDPYYWVDGVESFASIEDGDNAGRRIPDPDRSSFPAYYLPDLVPTNSTTEDFHGKEAKNLVRGTLNRPIDKFYRSILGSQVQGIPYQYGARNSRLNTTVTFNKAIDGNDPNRSYPRTIVGTYYKLADSSPELAHRFVEDFTRREGVNEVELMNLLGATPDATNTRYTGGPFRSSGDAENPDYQELVAQINLALAKRTIRG